MTKYWQDMLMCHRKGFCHISHNQCLEIYETILCDPCHNYYDILETQDHNDIECERRRQERKALAPLKRRRKS